MERERTLTKDSGESLHQLRESRTQSAGIARREVWERSSQGFGLRVVLMIGDGTVSGGTSACRSGLRSSLGRQFEQICGTLAEIDGGKVQIEIQS